MDTELHWLAQRIEELREAVQKSRWHLEEVREYRGELMHMWQDNCSREMTRRFLDPLDAEGVTSLVELDRQTDLLQSCHAALDQAADFCNVSLVASAELRQLVDEAESIFRALTSIVSEAIERTGESSAYAAQALNFLHQAEAAGA